MKKLKPRSWWFGEEPWRLADGALTPAPCTELFQTHFPCGFLWWGKVQKHAAVRIGRGNNGLNWEEASASWNLRISMSAANALAQEVAGDLGGRGVSFYLEY